MKIVQKVNAMVVVLGLAAGIGLVSSAGCVSSGRPHETVTQDQEDRNITASVESALRATDYQYPDVKVETVNREVFLRGRVDSPEHKHEAGHLAQQGGDVKDVVNHLRVE